MRIGEDYGFKGQTFFEIYKVSDTVLTEEELANGFTIAFDGEVFECTVGECVDYRNGYFILGESVVVVPESGVGKADDDGMFFSESGTYFLYGGEGEYTEFLTISGYTGFPHSENCGHQNT